MYTKKQRCVAGFMCAIFCAVIILSLVFLTERVEHTCVGDNCPTCTCIHKTQQTLNELSTGVVSGIVCFSVIVFNTFSKFIYKLILLTTTLVSLKVRLDN